MCIHSIVSEYDIFYSDQHSELVEKNVEGGKMLMMNSGDGYKPCRFFSTDPKRYLESSNQITRFYF